MALNNTLQQVQTYQRSGLAFLQNLNCFFGEVTNKRFQDFQNITTNLGSVVTFDLPPRMTVTQGLIAQFQGVSQRVFPLAVDQAVNVSYAFTAQERIFNVDKDTESYMKQFGMSAIKRIGAQAEANIAKNLNSSMPVNDSAGNPTGALHTESGPYRYFGNGTQQINSFQQLAEMLALFKNYGSVTNDRLKVVIPDVNAPAIIGNGLNQFAPRRNDDLAMSWELGTTSGLQGDFYISNLLPIQYAGSVGNLAQTLTLTGTNDPTGANITQLTFSGASASDANAIKSGDLLQFIHTDGFTNLFYLTFQGQQVSANNVQIRVTANAASDVSGNVTVSITPPLQSAPGATQNLNASLQPGMRVQSLPDHRCGLVLTDDAFFLAMPKLPLQPPFDTANETDADTGVSMRMTYGSTFGQNQLGMVHDMIWGACLVPEYCMRIAFPITP